MDKIFCLYIVCETKMGAIFTSSIFRNHQQKCYLYYGDMDLPPKDAGF